VSSIIFGFLAAAIPVVIAITLHEAAHGYAAWALGDDTAKRLGRLSLNPLAHVDRVGTILLPGFLVLSQLATIGHVAFMFGWAKPVPVSAWRFRDPRRGMMLVAAAGPLMNFFLAWLGALALHAIPVLASTSGGAEMQLEFVSVFIIANLALGLFNLIPLPPLDGGRIAVGLLPEGAAKVWARLERAGILLVLLLLFLLPAALHEFGIEYDPVRQYLGAAIVRAAHAVLWLAGASPFLPFMFGDGSDL
jgi:Zn-dependent protease